MDKYSRILERDSLLWPHILDKKFHFFKDYIPCLVLDRLVDMYVISYVVVHTLIN